MSSLARWCGRPRQWLLFLAITWALLPMLLPAMIHWARLHAADTQLGLGLGLGPHRPRDDAYLDKGETDKGVSWPAGVWWENKRLAKWKGCVSHAAEKTPAVRSPYGYLRITCRGGVNQQRQQICDAVALAAYLQTHLVLPVMAKNEYWKDSSKFEHIFDVPHFIESLKKDVVVVREEDVPKIASVRPAYEIEPPEQADLIWWDKFVRAKLFTGCVVHVVSMVDRLHYSRVTAPIQQLRCRACFFALRWHPRITDAAHVVRSKLLTAAAIANTPGYLALHLRLEKDSLSHSGCRIESGNTNDAVAQAEDTELTLMSKKLWKDTPKASATDQKAAGHCPLTAAEAARWLEGVGYPYDTPIYLAGGKPVKGSRIEDLHAIYPNVFSKDTLLSEKELARFQGHPSLLAGLDYQVCLNATVFVATHGGNMADFLIGERVYNGGGLSLSPHKTFLMELFGYLGVQGRTHLKELRAQVRRRHADMLTLPIRPLEDVGGKPVSVYRMPLPDCVCHGGKSLLQTSQGSSHAKGSKGGAAAGLHTDWLKKPNLANAGGAHAVGEQREEVPRIWKAGWVPGSLAHGKAVVAARRRDV